MFVQTVPNFFNLQPRTRATFKDIFKFILCRFCGFHKPPMTASRLTHGPMDHSPEEASKVVPRQRNTKYGILKHVATHSSPLLDCRAPTAPLLLACSSQPETMKSRVLVLFLAAQKRRKRRTMATTRRVPPPPCAQECGGLSGLAGVCFWR